MSRIPGDAGIKTPDFIICGAARSGTTWLLKALDNHPATFMARPFVPEPKFFHLDELYAKGLDHYLQTWFSNVPQGAVAGEKDTNYLENPQSASRIRKDLPGVKLLFVLREPGERAFSNYLWSKQNGWETLDFQQALEEEEERDRTLPWKLRYSRPHSYLGRSLYARMLAPFYDLFPEEQILCLNFEDIRLDPEGLLTRTHAFLGLEPRPGDARELGVVNDSRKEAASVMPPETRQWLDIFFAGPNLELFALLGPSFRPWERSL